MNVTSMTSALFGGAVIGTAATLLLASLGRIAGISGVLAGIFARKPEALSFRISFLVGLFVAGTAATAMHVGVSHDTRALPFAQLIIAGLLVGFGARLGGGCTSGHGVCGISRLSPRSIVATIVFMTTGAVTVFVTHHILGGAP
jgi:uncharacterized membrane protein YedE/YeeE